MQTLIIRVNNERHWSGRQAGRRAGREIGRIVYCGTVLCLLWMDNNYLNETLILCRVKKLYHGPIGITWRRHVSGSTGGRTQGNIHRSTDFKPQATAKGMKCGIDGIQGARGARGVCFCGFRLIWTYVNYLYSMRPVATSSGVFCSILTTHTHTYTRLSPSLPLYPF